jgi:hypothetical protein
MRHALRSILLSLSVSALFLWVAPAARAADAKPDEEGFVRDWLMLAPFSIGEGTAQDELDKKQLGDEGAIKPKEGDKQKVGDKEQAWKAVRAKDYYLDLNETLKTDNEDVLGYLVAYIVCDKEMADLTLLIGSNDQAKVFVNGKELVKFDQTRTIEKDSDKAEKVTLNKGVNTVVFKVLNEKQNWQACLRFKDKDGKAVTGFTVRTAP